MRFFIFITFLLSSCLALQAQQNDSIKSNRLEEIQVSASIKPFTNLSATPLQVLSEREIQKQGIHSVFDAVRRFNGVVLKDYGGIGGLKTVSIRGMGAEYTAVSYDGIMINNLQSGQVDIGRFSLDNVSMLSLSIGQTDDIFLPAKSYSTAGILNLQIKKPLFTNNDNHLFHAKMTTGSFGHFEPMLHYAYKVSNKVSLSANINWQRADGRYKFTQKEDKDEPNKKLKNSDTDILRSEINLYTELSKSDFLDVKFYYFDSERGLPGGVIIYDMEKNDRLWDKNAFSQITYNKIFSSRWKWKSVAKFDYNYEKHKIDRKKTTRYRQHEVYWSNTAIYEISPSLSTSVSQDLLFNNLKTKSTNSKHEYSTPDRYSSYTSLSAQYKIEQLTLTASALNTYVREKVSATDNNRKTTFEKFSPALSASVKPLRNINLRLRASYKHIYRIPSFSELFYMTTVVERKLKPESSKQYNIGTTWVGSFRHTPIEYLNISLDGYYSDVNDKIIITPTPFMGIAENKGKVKIKGLDAKVSTTIKICDQISSSISGTYSYINAYDDEKTDKVKGGQLRFTPKNSGSAALTINNPWVNFSYSTIFSDIRYTMEDNTKNNELKSYTEHSISLFKELDYKQYNIYANASIINLWNKQYNIIHYYPMPGRSFKVTVGCKF